MYAQSCCSSCDEDYPLTAAAPQLGTYIDYRTYGRQPGLGFIPWGTLIGGAVDLARTFIGGSDATSCPGQMSGRQLGNLLSRLTPSEMAQLDAAVAATKPGSWYRPGFVGVDLDMFAFAIAGGGDCTVSTTAGKALVALVNRLFQAHPEALAAPFPTGTGPQPIDGGPVTYYPVPQPSSPPPPVLLPTMPNGSTPPLIPGPVLTTEPAPTVPSDSSWLDKIKDVIGDAASAAGRAAATAAASSTYNNLPAQQQYDIQQQIRAQQGFGTGVPTPLLLGGAALLAVLLLRPAPARR